MGAKVNQDEAATRYPLSFAAYKLGLRFSRAQEVLDHIFPCHGYTLYPGRDCYEVNGALISTECGSAPVQKIYVDSLPPFDRVGLKRKDTREYIDTSRVVGVTAKHPQGITMLVTGLIFILLEER